MSRHLPLGILALVGLGIASACTPRTTKSESASIAVDGDFESLFSFEVADGKSCFFSIIDRSDSSFIRAFTGEPILPETLKEALSQQEKYAESVIPMARALDGALTLLYIAPIALYAGFFATHIAADGISLADAPAIIIPAAIRDVTVGFLGILGESNRRFGSPSEYIAAAEANREAASDEVQAALPAGGEKLVQETTFNAIKSALREIQKDNPTSKDSLCAAVGKELVKNSPKFKSAD